MSSLYAMPGLVATGDARSDDAGRRQRPQNRRNTLENLGETWLPRRSRCGRAGLWHADKILKSGNVGIGERLGRDERDRLVGEIAGFDIAGAAGVELELGPGFGGWGLRLYETNRNAREGDEGNCVSKLVGEFHVAFSFGE